LRRGLSDYGYVEGQNLAIEYRTTDQGAERERELAAELARLPVDVIVAVSTPVTQAAMQATSTIPVVFVGVSDPVATGLVASLARPGGNVTGVSSLSAGLSQKRLQLLKDTVPGASRVAVIWYAADPAGAVRFRELEMAAAVLGLQLQSLEIRRTPDLDGVFAVADRDQIDAWFVFTDAMTNKSRSRIVELVAQSRLPSMYEYKEWVSAGGLMAYGANGVAQYDRVVYYVNRILKGTSPADLPVEQPTEFDFVVNLKTAQALGITFPNEILLQVTEVIQ
jgi:putative ABC transport system substrate-binding protein